AKRSAALAIPKVEVVPITDAVNPKYRGYYLDLSGIVGRQDFDALAAIMHHAGTFLHEVWRRVRRRSVRADRCEATRLTTRMGLMCLVGGSSGHAAPRFMGRTA